MMELKLLSNILIVLLVDLFTEVVNIVLTGLQQIKETNAGQLVFSEIE